MGMGPELEENMSKMMLHIQTAPRIVSRGPIIVVHHTVHDVSSLNTEFENVADRTIGCSAR